MTQDTILANARLILENDLKTGAVVIRDGVIHDLDFTTAVPAGAVDCNGGFVAPGLVELHTDNLERHIEPRPKVDWPHNAAILAHDAELASTGITTVFDAMRIGSTARGDGGYRKYAREVASEILALRARDALKISHFLHLRAEVCSETLIEELSEFGEEDRIGIVSLMDHTPGQRQFRDISKLHTYMSKKHAMTDVEFEAHVDRLLHLRETYGEAHEAATVAEARRFGAVLASHDDTTAEQVAVSAGYGIHLAEFPTTVEAARACHAHDIHVMMGAPNLIRGGSHSGNVAAHELADLDLLDIISSDYVPAALLLSAVKLGRIWGDMARGIKAVTKTPARAGGLKDRGVLEVGQRGDVILFDLVEDTPMLRAVYVKGARVS